MRIFRQSRCGKRAPCGTELFKANGRKSKKKLVEDVVKLNSRTIITVIIIPISVYLLKFFPLLRALMEIESTSKKSNGCTFSHRESYEITSLKV